MMIRLPLPSLRPPAGGQDCPRGGFLLLCLAFWLILAGPLSALEVRQTIWGFDGHLVPDRFNPVSVLVDNPRPAAFDGQMMLVQTDGLGRGPQYLQRIFLAPHTSRWVQFYVFVGGNYVPHYSVQWGQRSIEQHFEFAESVSFGPPGCVWLRDAASPFAAAGSLKTFPEELFPTTVAATDALSAVVLDHAPHWEPARRDAFLDWLNRGGTLHLLPGTDGKFPAFTEGLEPLNGEDAEMRLGTGRIVRHQMAAREMSEKYLHEHGHPLPVLKPGQSPVVVDLQSLFFQRLSSLTRPTVSWTTIHLLALAYVAVIGPLHYRFRRKLDYRISILAFLAVVALFGTLFAVVGRRGYGESQTVNSVTIAHALGGGRFDTMQWISAFATTGDQYILKHDAPANLYGTGSSDDAGGARIFNGKDGDIELDIPLYSSRTFVHRAVMKGDDTAVTVEQMENAGKARLQTGPGFPKVFAEARLLAGNSFYTLEMHDGVLETRRGPAILWGDYFSPEKLRTAMSDGNFGRDPNPDAHRNLMPLLMARALGAQDVFANSVVETLDPGQPWRLCVLAPAPESFRLRGKGFDRERGWVLYIQDIPQP